MVKPKQTYNDFLGALLLVLSIRIGKSIIFYFWYDTAYMGTYLQIGLSACFLIGPFLYLFIRSFYNHPHKLDWKIHIGVMSFIIMTISFMYPYLEYRALWTEIIMNGILLQWLAYLIVSGVIVKKYWNHHDDNQIHWQNKKNWVLSIFIGTTLIWVAYVSAGLTSYMLGAVSFTFMLYIFLFILLMPHSKREAILSTPYQKYGGRIIEMNTAKRIIEQLKKVFQEEELYREPSLKLKDVADILKINPHELSQIINENLETNFSQLLNQYRIEKAKVMILKRDELTLEGIGYECGYKAKSTFYTAFKKETGSTPAHFKKNSQKSA